MTLVSKIDQSAENSLSGVGCRGFCKHLKTRVWVGRGRRANKEAFGAPKSVRTSFSVKHLGQWRYKYGVIVHGFGKVDVLHDRFDLP